MGRRGPIGITEYRGGRGRVKETLLTLLLDYHPYGSETQRREKAREKRIYYFLVKIERGEGRD